MAPDGDRAWVWIARVADVVALATVVAWAVDHVHGAGLPRTFGFYFVFFWGMVAATAGGLVWNLVNRWRQGRWPLRRQPPPYAGGSLEPHGEAALTWAVLSFGMVIVVLVALNLGYDFMPLRDQVVLYTGFLLGASAGSLLFYDGPTLNGIGFRDRVQSTSLSPAFGELLIGVIWSGLIAVPGFGIYALLQLLGIGNDKLLTDVVVTLLERVLLTVALTSTTIGLFVVVIPYEERFEQARGFAAGLALRLSLFLGLLSIR